MQSTSTCFSRTSATTSSAEAPPCAVLSVMTRATLSEGSETVCAAVTAASETPARGSRNPACHQSIAASVRTLTTKSARRRHRSASTRHSKIGAKSHGTNEITSGTIRPSASSAGRQRSAIRARTPSMTSQRKNERHPCLAPLRVRARLGREGPGAAVAACSYACASGTVSPASGLAGRAASTGARLTTVAAGSSHSSTRRDASVSDAGSRLAVRAAHSSSGRGSHRASVPSGSRGSA